MEASPTLIYKEGGVEVTVFAERHPLQAEAGNLSLAGGERQSVHEHRFRYRRIVLQRGDGHPDLLAERGLRAWNPKPDHPIGEQ